MKSSSTHGFSDNKQNIWQIMSVKRKQYPFFKNNTMFHCFWIYSFHNFDCKAQKFIFEKDTKLNLRI